MFETSQGTWLGGARKDSLWLCYARSLAGRQKSVLSGNWRRPKPTPYEERLGKLGEEKEEPATERRRKYTDLELDVVRERSKSPVMPQPRPWR